MSRVYREYTNNKTDNELIGFIGFDDSVMVNRSVRKRILITGANSYIGQFFMKYASDLYSENFVIEELDMIDGSWRNVDFSSFDIVYHVAGIAHADVGNVSDEVKEKYYKINTDLTLEVANKAKADGVKTFIFMSSVIVYGDSAPYGKEKLIDKNTVPVPANFYGDSKLQADVGVRELATDDFRVMVLRPPMIYGKGSKGNYPILSKLARKLPVFPNVKNERSMLYIENLCEFLCQIMLIEDVKRNAIVLIPQNAEWTNTCEMVKNIADVCDRKIKLFSVLNPAVAIGGLIPGKIGDLVNKAFGNNCYSHDLSQYDGLDYQIVGLKESVKRTEG